MFIMRWRISFLVRIGIECVWIIFKRKFLFLILMNLLEVILRRGHQRRLWGNLLWERIFRKVGWEILMLVLSKNHWNLMIVNWLMGKIKVCFLESCFSIKISEVFICCIELVSMIFRSSSFINFVMENQIHLYLLRLSLEKLLGDSLLCLGSQLLIHCILMSEEILSFFQFLSSKKWH